MDFDELGDTMEELSNCIIESFEDDEIENLDGIIYDYICITTEGFMKTEKTRLQELAAGIEDDMKTTLGSLYKGISIETKGLPLHSQESISIHESGSYSAADIELRKDYVTEVLKAMVSIPE